MPRSLTFRGQIPSGEPVFSTEAVGRIPITLISIDKSQRDQPKSTNTNLQILNTHTQIKREIIDAFKKRPAQNFSTRDHISQEIEWYLQTG